MERQDCAQRTPTKGSVMEGLICILALPVALLLPLLAVALIAASGGNGPDVIDRRAECVAAGGVPLLGEGGWDYKGCMAGQPLPVPVPENGK